jgi:hypothetical protein
MFYIWIILIICLKKKYASRPVLLMQNYISSFDVLLYCFKQKNLRFKVPIMRKLCSQYLLLFYNAVDNCFL